MTRPAQVVVHIEALELHGFAVERRHAIADAFSRELARLLETETAVGTDSQPSVLSHAAIDAAAPPNLVGAAIARAVHTGLRR